MPIKTKIIQTVEIGKLVISGNDAAEFIKRVEVIKSSEAFICEPIKSIEKLRSAFRNEEKEDSKLVIEQLYKELWSLQDMLEILGIL